MVNGKQTHGSRPWQGVDPIVVAAQIVNALQTVVSRQIDITQNPGRRSPSASSRAACATTSSRTRVEMIGTIRTFDAKQKQQIFDAMKRLVENTAEASGATATFEFEPYCNPVTYNNPEAHGARAAQPAESRRARRTCKEIPLITGAEDFAYFGEKIPAFFFMVGVTPKGTDVLTAPANHSPLFYLDETAMPLATRAMTAVAVDYLNSGK